MLKFSGYPYLIRGQTVGDLMDADPPGPAGAIVLRYGLANRCQCFWGESAHEAGQTPNTKQSLRV
jgi:hypothetical protein